VPHSSAKLYTTDTHRSIPPAETIARVRPYFAQMGIARVANVTGLDRIGLPVIMVSRPNSRSVAVSQGKGLSLDSAIASGVMQAAETWHGERIARPLRYASFADLARDSAVIYVDRLPRVSGSRFHNAHRTCGSRGRMWFGARPPGCHMRLSTPTTRGRSLPAMAVFHAARTASLPATTCSKRVATRSAS